MNLMNMMHHDGHIAAWFVGFKNPSVSHSAPWRRICSLHGDQEGQPLHSSEHCRVQPTQKSSSGFSRVEPKSCRVGHRWVANNSQQNLVSLKTYFK
jgi:hypothetical protein